MAGNDSSHRPDVATKAQAKQDAKEVILFIPRFIQLLYRLVKDPEVRVAAKAVSAACIAYVLWPLDLIADFIPVLGQIDDLYVIALAITFLLSAAGAEKIKQHWTGKAKLADLIARIDKIVLFFLSDKQREALRQKLDDAKRRDPEEYRDNVDKAEVVDLHPEDFEVRGEDDPEGETR